MTPTTTRIQLLVVDDEVSIAALLSTAFRFRGFDVTVASTARQAIDHVTRHRPDAVLLDLTLPDSDGFTLYDRLRQAGLAAPVLFLTARHNDEDKVRGLSVGADDYVTKPFNINELVARVRILLRRGPVFATTQVGPPHAAGIQLDPLTQQAMLDDRTVELSGTEYKLLNHLITHAGRPVAKADLQLAVWGHNRTHDYGNIETYIYYLRRKLADTEQRLIRTIRGVGYLVPAQS
ncbi:response regulator transcription factor [Kutzneria buriramensis]|uniref:Two-component system OmpR family response regulator n=1 Tax=Kutzneria buriramensis TaxID=1045776 RepID=A0A3E0GUZ4_9PSEU|nr:response regulator transcription factor [Kutzneria buriramensis]REH28574.1 two-component system OmpR family response regulator [Kutzneria buriramensis]